MDYRPAVHRRRPGRLRRGDRRGQKGLENRGGGNGPAWAAPACSAAASRPRPSCIRSKPSSRSTISPRSACTWKNIGFSLEEIKRRKIRIVSKQTRGIETPFQTERHPADQGQGADCRRQQHHGRRPKRNTAGHIVVATGSRPAELPFLKWDGQQVVSSDDLLKLESVPETMLVIGAGAVGLEWALIYSYLGCKVTVVEIMETIVPGSDQRDRRHL